MTKYRIVTKPGPLGGVFYAVQQSTPLGLSWKTIREYYNPEFAQKHMDELIKGRDIKAGFKSEVVRSE